MSEQSGPPQTSSNQRTTEPVPPGPATPTPEDSTDALTEVGTPEEFAAQAAPGVSTKALRGKPVGEVDTRMPPTS